jgi:hypothetical protein
MRGIAFYSFRGDQKEVMFLREKIPAKERGVLRHRNERVHFCFRERKKTIKRRE